VDGSAAVRQMSQDRDRAAGMAGLAEAEVRQLLELAPDPIVIVDALGRIVAVNRQAEATFGYGRAELIGQGLSMLIPERFREAHREHHVLYFAAPSMRPMGAGLELYARRRDGSELPVEISLGHLKTGDDLLVTAIVRDISERKRSQQELEHQKDEFLASVSHDLRTPVTAIKASIGVVLANEPADMPQPLHRMLVNIDLAADRLTTLVNDLLELTRLQAGLVRLRRARADLRALALKCAGSIEPLAHARGQRVVVGVPTEPFPATVDAGRVERALLNLLSNAHKYGREGGEIRLRLEGRDREALFAVADDGPGIPATEQGPIFERFYRTKTAAAGGAPGSGLGLPIARAMAELHGGRLWVESAVGRGSTFYLAIPVDGGMRDDGEEATREDTGG
jgi:PAS domain S-box-containing protein